MFSTQSSVEGKALEKWKIVTHFNYLENSILFNCIGEKIKLKITVLQLKVIFVQFWLDIFVNIAPISLLLGVEFSF